VWVSRRVITPRPGSSNVEERRDFFPPLFVSLAKAIDTPSAVLLVPFDEFNSSLMGRERRSHIDAEPGPKPRVFTDTLMDTQSDFKYSTRSAFC
jgi:hypothetical protein